MVASLSKLFSDSTIPFLHYRALENIYCHSLNACNISREDAAYDAIINNCGIGLKTFIAMSDNKNEKIAEFNKHSKTIQGLEMESLAKKLAYYRNERIEFANRLYQIKKACYHCVARRDNKLLLFDEPYQLIDTANIKDLKETRGGISFSDNRNYYTYNRSKSTLFKKFIVAQDAMTIDVNMLTDPYAVLEKIVVDEPAAAAAAPYPYVILPLYSTRKGGEMKEVPLHSGLNQWNAGGRERDPGEVYIPIPMEIHHAHPSFFPPEEQVFELETPTRERLKAKLCQENSKALMTNPNNALADWLLRGIFNLQEGTPLTYDRLLEAGTDCVKVEKISLLLYRIDFAALGAYEDFIV